MKLHIKSLALVALLAVFSSYSHATTVSLQLSLMWDTSASVSPAEFILQRNGYVSAFQNSAIQNTIESLPQGMAVSIGYFSTNASNPPGYETDAGFGINPVIGWTQLNTAADAAAFATAIAGLSGPGAGGGGVGKTNIADAVQYGKNSFSNGFEGGKKIIDISSDGIQNVLLDGNALTPCDEGPMFNGPLCIFQGGSLIENQSTMAADNGIMVNAIYISGGDDLPPGVSEQDFIDYYNEFVRTEDGFVLSSNFENFEEFITLKLQKEIGSAVPVPAAVWLFGSALLGLVARAKVKRATT